MITVLFGLWFTFKITKEQVSDTQCGKFFTFLPLRFGIKSVLVLVSLS